MTRTSRGRAVPLLLLGLLAACGSCGKKEPVAPDPGPISYLSAGTPRAAVVRDLAKLGAAISALQRTKLAGLMAAAAGQPDAEALVGPLVRQLGFDPRTPEGIASAGIDGSRGLAVGEDGETQLLVIAAADPGKLAAYLDALGKRAGGVSVTESALAGGTARAYGSEGVPARVAFTVLPRYAVVAQGGDPVAALGRAVALTEGTSLAGDATFAKVRAQLGSPDVVIWSAPGARAFPGAPAAGGAAGISLSTTGISLRAVALQTPQALAALRPAGKVAGEKLVPLLPQESFLVARLGGEPTSLAPFLDSLLSPRLQARLKQAGLDVRADVLEKLEPGVAVGVGLAKDIDLSGGLPSGDQLDVNQTNPFRFVDLTVLARVKDPAAAGAVLGKVPALGEQLRFSVARRKEKGLDVWSSAYAAGDGLTWALSGSTFVATGGKDTFPRALERAAGGQPAFAITDPQVKATFDQAASAVYLDVPRLTAGLRAIPEFAYGVGGFRIKQVVDRWADMLAEVKGIAATFSVADEAVIVDAQIALREAAAAPRPAADGPAR